MCEVNFRVFSEDVDMVKFTELVNGRSVDVVEAIFGIGMKVVPGPAGAGTLVSLGQSCAGWYCAAACLCGDVRMCMCCCC